MTNRFEAKNGIFSHITDTVYRWSSIVILIAICILFYIAIDASGRSTIEKQQTMGSNRSSADTIT